MTQHMALRKGKKTYGILYWINRLNHEWVRSTDLAEYINYTPQQIGKLMKPLWSWGFLEMRMGRRHKMEWKITPLGRKFVNLVEKHGRSAIFGIGGIYIYSGGGMFIREVRETNWKVMDLDELKEILDNDKDIDLIGYKIVKKVR